MDSLRPAPRGFVSRLLSLLTQLALAAFVVLLATLAFTSGPEPPPDLDIDSDNDNGMGWPDRSEYEESIEEVCGNPQYPGKFVAVNDNDDDEDGVPDFADGYDLDGQWWTADDYNMRESDFVPVVLEIPYPASVWTTWVWVSYDCSPPLSMGRWGDPPTYYPPSGYGGTLRLWRPYPGCPLLPAYDRNPANVGGYGGGDFVGPGWYQAWELGFSDYSRTITLHVEAVTPSLQLGDEPIYVWVFPNGVWQYPYYSECVRVSCVRIDLDVDSDNTNGFDAPSRTDYEDQIEDAAWDPELPGKFVQVNDCDEDGDGIPDFADGFDLVASDPNDDLTAGKRFVHIVLEVPHPLWDIPGVAQAGVVTFSYSASDPACVTRDPQSGVYTPAPGSLRLWRRDGGEARTKTSLAAAADPGDFVPSGAPVKLSALGLSPDNRTITLYLEGISRTTGSGPERIEAAFDPDGPQGPLPAICRDAVRVRCISIDLDADSDNTNGFEAPDRSPREDQTEEATGTDERPGKIILVDNDDADGDGIPDFADGFNYLDGAWDDDTSTGTRFVPIILEVPEPIALDRAEVEFSYDASDPAAVEPTMWTPYQFPCGALRIWTKDGGAARDKRAVSDGGDFVPPNVRLTPAQLGLATRLVTLYVEAVRESSTTADLAIRARVYPLGASGPWCDDTIRLTAARIRILARNQLTSEELETPTLIASSLPKPGGAADGWDSAPGAVASYRIEVADPRSGFTTLSLGSQQLQLEPAGWSYATAPFVGILPEDQPLVDADAEFVLRLDSIAEHEYNADVLPGDPAADPAPWDVASAGDPPVAASDGILSVDTTAAEAAYWASTAAPELWQPAGATVVELSFCLQAHGEAGGDGAFAVRMGDAANHWWLGIRPDRFVHYPGALRAEVPFPAQIGQQGNLIDGAFHTLRISHAPGAAAARVSIDYDANEIEFELQGVGTPAQGLAWGDPGALVSGQVAYDFVRWWHVFPGEALYQTRPSLLLAGNQVCHFAAPQLSISYNPTKPPVIRGEVTPPTDLDQEACEAANQQANDMEAARWRPINPDDPGEFGKDFHAGFTGKLRGKERWAVNVCVEKNTNRVLSIDGRPAGVPSQNYNEVDAIGLQKGYRPKIGVPLEQNKYQVYEAKTSATGSIDRDQLAALRRINGNRPVKLIRSPRVYDPVSRGFKVLDRVRKVSTVLTLLGLASSAWNLVHADEFEDDWNELARKMAAVRDAETGTEKSLASIEAAAALRRYLGHFMIDHPGTHLAFLAVTYWVVDNFQMSD